MQETKKPARGGGGAEAKARAHRVRRARRLEGERQIAGRRGELAGLLEDGHSLAVAREQADAVAAQEARQQVRRHFGFSAFALTMFLNLTRW